MNSATIKEKSTYRKSDKFYKHLEKVKEIYSIKGINKKYWEEFEYNSDKTKTSLCQYKSAVKRFTDNIDKDILLTTIDELEIYLNKNFKDDRTKENQSRYIKSFLTFTIGYNIDKASKITNEKLILSLIPKEYKSLVKVLMYKN